MNAKDIIKILESKSRAGSGDTDGNIYYAYLQAEHFGEVANLISAKSKEEAEERFNRACNHYNNKRGGCSKSAQESLRLAAFGKEES
jgi:hypothetical protein